MAGAALSYGQHQKQSFMQPMASIFAKHLQIDSSIDIIYNLLFYQAGLQINFPNSLEFEKILSCKFSELSIASFCQFHTNSSRLISRNSSPHARHVSLEWMQSGGGPSLRFKQILNVIFRISWHSPEPNAGIPNAESSRMFCDPPVQNAGVSRFSLTRLIKVLEELGLLGLAPSKVLDHLELFVTLEFLGFSSDSHLPDHLRLVGAEAHRNFTFSEQAWLS